MPSAKTPKEKLKICFGTPLQRSDSKQNVERPASKTEKQLRFKNGSAKKTFNIQFEQPPANFQFSKRLSKKNSQRGSEPQRDSIEASGLSGKENSSRLVYEYSKSPLQPVVHMPLPFQDLSNRKVQQPAKLESEYFAEEPAPTSPFVLDYPCRALG